MKYSRNTPKWVKANTARALVQIQRVNPAAHRVVVNNIKKIQYQRNGPDGIFVDERVFQTSYATAVFEWPWWPGVLIHDATHGFLKRTGKPWYGRWAELYCIRVQTKMVMMLHGPQWMVQYLRGLSGGHSGMTWTPTPKRGMF